MKEQIIAGMIGALLSGAGAVVGWYAGVEGRLAAIESDVRTIKCYVRPDLPACLGERR